MNQKLCDRVIRTERRSEDGCDYTYELILREGGLTHDWRLPLFSVRISMKDCDGRFSEREARDLFTNREKAIEFFEKMVRNLATPINLGYVVEDELRA